MLPTTGLLSCGEKSRPAIGRILHCLQARFQWKGAKSGLQSRPLCGRDRKTLQLGVPRAWCSSRDRQIVYYRAGHIICYAHAAMSRLSMGSDRNILDESLRYQNRKRLGSTVEKAQAEQWRF